MSLYFIAFFIHFLSFWKPFPMPKWAHVCFQSSFFRFLEHHLHKKPGKYTLKRSALTLSSKDLLCRLYVNCLIRAFYTISGTLFADHPWRYCTGWAVIQISYVNCVSGYKIHLVNSYIPSTEAGRKPLSLIQHNLKKK